MTVPAVTPLPLVCTTVTDGVPCGRRLWPVDVVYQDPTSPTSWNTRPPGRAEQLSAAHRSGWRVEISDGPDVITCWTCRNQEGTP